MKTIYKIIMLGLLCLVSNLNHAQIVQYSEDGTKSCIDCDEKAGGERSCLCFAPFQLGIFNNEISNFGGSLKDKWLYEQELLLATAITGIAYFDMYNSPFGLPSDYNFTEIQLNYFQNVETNALAFDYFDKVDELLKTDGYDEVALQSATRNADILSIRQREGTTNTSSYGDLKYQGRYLRDISNSEIDNLLNEQLNIRDANRGTAVLYGERHSRLERMLTDGYIARRLANNHVRHYVSLSYEGSIRFMTRYMVWVNEQDRHILSLPFGNPDNIYTLEEDEVEDISSLMFRAMGDGPLMEGYTPRTFPDPDDNKVLFDLALNSLPTIARDFIYRESNQFKSVVKKYFEENKYSQEAMDMVKDLMTAHVQGSPMVNDRLVFSHFGGYPPGHPILLWHTGASLDGSIVRTWNISNEISEDPMDSFFDVTDAFEGTLHPNTEGSLIRRALYRENITWDDSLYTNENLANIFDLSGFDLSGIYPFGQLAFEDNIGQELKNNGFSQTEFFQSELLFQSALSMADSDLPTAEHYIRVYNLVNTLNLSQAQEDWLVGHKDQAELLNILIQNNLDNNQVPANVSTLATEIANFGVANVDVDLAQQIVSTMLTSLNSSSDFDIAPFIQNEQFLETGFTVEGSCCPDDPFIMNDPLYGRELGIDLVNALIDGFGNLVIAFIDYGVGDGSEGELIRKMLEKMGVDVGSDIDNKTLGELYQLRKRDRRLVIEYQSGFVENLIDLGFATLDVMIILSPSRGGGAYLAVNGGGRITAATMRSYLARLKDIARTTLAGGRGYRSFDAFKRIEGNASSGNALHHIVEQGGHRGLNQQKFGKSNIHNTKNIIDIPTGSGSLHQKVTSYYQSKPAFTNGKTVREWLSDKSFQEQYEFGLQVLRDNGWDGILGIFD
ncbi:hypothetical protein [Aquimarina celericrescens]|uniref:Uncharacterized protein n=1 Tax=Aquimarina celericrescens TaxID=1964542 RepID=A0ABW5AW28_9FLAO|nr:hypothetical protein [Aquimarina celericrescens]